MSQTSDLTIDDLKKIIREELTTFDSGKAHVELVPRQDPKPAQPVPAAPEHKELHGVYDFMQYCPSGNCGEKNPNYRKAQHRCASCKVPVDDKAPKCWNCGGKDAELNPE